MKTKLVPIGNSRGVRIPKPMIKEAGLNDEVDIQFRDGAIIITSIMQLRSGWAESAKTLHSRQGDQLLDTHTQTRFDKADWNW